MKTSLSFFFLLVTATALGQNPNPTHFNLYPQVDYPLVLSGAVTLSFGSYLDVKHAPISESEFRSLKDKKIGAVDKFFYNNIFLNHLGNCEDKMRPPSMKEFPLTDQVAEQMKRYNSCVKPSHTISSVLLVASAAAPFLVSLEQNQREDYGLIATMYLEAFSLNWGINDIVKSTVRRPRPETYYWSSQDLSYEQFKEFEKESKIGEANLSFYSGHTSVTATSCFFMARMLTEYSTNKDWNPAIWTVAATIPAVVAFYRIKGGNHFFSDVLIGYGVGAFIGGYAVPSLHKIKG